MASLSSGVRLPVVARHKASLIFLENSGVIGSLGELTPNISDTSYVSNTLRFPSNIEIIQFLFAKISNNLEMAKKKCEKFGS